MKAFDGSPREAIPPMRELIKGGAAELVAMLLFVFFGCGSASSNVHKTQAGEWDSASVVVYIDVSLEKRDLSFATVSFAC